MARDFSELEAQMSPESRARVAQRVREAEEHMLAIDLGRRLGRPCEEVARELGLHWPPEFDPAEYDPLPLESLFEIVQRLGGEARIDIKLPKGTITIEPRPPAASLQRRTA